MNLPSLKKSALVLAAFVVLAGGLAGWWFSAGAKVEQKVVSAAKPALSIAVVRPRQRSLPLTLTANGSISAWQEASIGAEASGLRLIEVRANVGDVVRAGQVLATFAPESVEADLAQARASVLEAEATALEATGNADRARTIASTGAWSKQQINQYLTGEQTAKARVEAAKALLDVQLLRLKKTEVHAPDSGIISARNATIGAVVANGTELFRMIRQGRLEWRAEVTSAELGRLRVGTTARLTAASGAELEGKLRMIAPTVDPQTRFALAYVDLPAIVAPAAGGAQLATGAVKAGMFAKGEFLLGDSQAMTVPQTAVLVRDGFSYVFRLGADNRVARIKVQTGRMVADQIEIISPLDPDARLVASGASFLNDGDLVRVVDDASAVPSAAASNSN